MLNFELVEKAIDRSSGEKKNFYFPTAKSSSKFASSASLINSYELLHPIVERMEFLDKVMLASVAQLKQPLQRICKQA